MERVAILGAGRMGIPMALLLAAAGHRVDLADVRGRDAAGWAALQGRAEQEWAATGELLAAEGLGDVTAARERIVWRPCLGPWLGEVDCLFDALPEQLPLKAAAFAAAARWLRPDALVASTTSTIAPDDLAATLPHPERFLVSHWLNPAFFMPLVEVAPGTATTAENREWLLSLLRRAGKVPVLCAGRPGFIIPRLQAMLMNEAARMVDEGVATAAEIDRAVKAGLGFRYLMLGLLEFADLGGIDTLYHAGNYLSGQLHDAKFSPPPAVAERMAAGDIGLKTGRGFYDWRSPERQALPQATRRRYLHLLRFLGLTPPCSPPSPSSAGPSG